MENIHSNSEAVFQTLFNINPQPMWVYMIQTGEIREVNEAAIEYFGYGKEEFSVYVMQKLYPEKNNREKLDFQLQTGIYKYILKDGDVSRLQIQTSIFNIGGQKAVLVVATDITVTIAAEIERAAADEKYRDVQKIARLGYWSRNLDTDISDWSDQMYVIFGQDPVTFIPTYDNLINCFHPDDRYLLNQNTFSKLAQNGQSDFEHRIITPDGETKWVFQCLQLQKDADENILNIKGIIQDITEKKKLDDKFKAVFDNTNDAILIGDDNGKCLDYNNAAVDIFGYSHQELNMMDFNQLLKYPDEKRFSSIWEKFLNGKIENSVIQLQRKDGYVMTVNFNGKPNILPGMHLCIITDITEQIEQQRQLQASERRFKALVQEGTDLIGILDHEGNYMFVGETHDQLLGKNPQQYLGTNAFDRIHPLDKDRIAKLFLNLEFNDQVKTEPFRFRHHNGSWRWIMTTATNLMHDPAVDGIVINSRDITDLKENLQKIEFQNDKLKEIAWAQSHTVRAPLCRIMAVINLMNDYQNSEMEIKTYLDLILASSHELDVTIKQISEKTIEV